MPKTATPSRLLLRLLDGFFLLLAVGALYRLFLAGEKNCEDFRVYWKTAQAWVSGISPYVIRSEDHGFVIKYPLWVLPIFLPLAPLTYEHGRYFWYVLEVACLGYSIWWTIAQGVPRRMAIFIAYLYWWMWQSHFSAGQVEILLLVVALWACPLGSRSGVATQVKPSTWSTAWKDALLVYLVSIKVFSLITLTGIWKRFLNARVLLAGGAIFISTHVIFLLVYWLGGGFHGQSASTVLIQLYQEWSRAAASGGSELGLEVIRGQGNHGFTALILRTLDVDHLNARADALVASGLAVSLAAIWHRLSKILSEPERWVGWIALGVVIHPLAWHHYYILVYPLCAFAFARACETRRPGLIFLALLGTSCIGLFIPQVIGKELVKPLEMAGVKAWGAAISAAVLLASVKVLRREGQRA